MPNTGNTVRLSYLMNNGSVLTDRKALVVDTEVISANLEGSAVPRRESAQTYVMRAWDQPPTPGDEEQRETVDPPYPEDDTLFVTRTVPSVHTASRAGMDLEKGINDRLGVLLQLAVVTLSGVALLGSLALVAVNGGGGDGPDPAESRREVPAPPPVILPDRDGK